MAGLPSQSAAGGEACAWSCLPVWLPGCPPAWLPLAAACEAVAVVGCRWLPVTQERQHAARRLRGGYGWLPRWQPCLPKASAAWQPGVAVLAAARDRRRG